MSAARKLSERERESIGSKIDALYRRFMSPLATANRDWPSDHGVVQELRRIQRSALGIAQKLTVADHWAMSHRRSTALRVMCDWQPSDED